MGIAFATDYKDIITFVYYVATFVFQLVVFLVGTLYIRYRNEKQRIKDDEEERSRRIKDDEEESLRRDEEDRRHKEEKEKERLQEWRKFSQELNLKYIDMMRDKVVQRLQCAKESLEASRILPHISGLDVVLYMIDDEDSFPSAVRDGSDHLGTEQTFKPTALGKLRDDLRSVFVLINYCWSLCLLGEIPENFNQEMRRIVIVLGNLALPFCCKESDEHRFTIIQECLEKFGANTPSPEQIRRRDLTQEISYLKILQYELDMKTDKIFTLKKGPPSYHPSEEAKLFRQLHYDLEEGDGAAIYALRFAKEVKERMNDWSGEDPSEKGMVRMLIHNVRNIIWEIESGVPPLGAEDSTHKFRKVLKIVKKETLFPLNETAVDMRIDRFKDDLKFYKKGIVIPKKFKRLKDLIDQFQLDLKKSGIPEFANVE